MMTPSAETFVTLRREFHAHPELAREETRTSSTISRLLAEWGYRVHDGIGGHGVVGVLSRGHGSKSIALRADIDALPISEETGAPYASRHAGKMHACGHDGHTAIMLATAHDLAKRPFGDGTVVAVFQPAEEIGQGAKAMFDDGLLERFGFDAVFGLHNLPGMPAGEWGFRSGPFWAALDDLVVDIRGFGGHGGLPHLTRDPVVAGAQMVLALQSIVSRNVDPLQAAVVTVGAFNAGAARNVVPNAASLGLNIRSFEPDVRDLIIKRIGEIATGMANAFQVEISMQVRHNTRAVVNDPTMTAFARDVAIGRFGTEKVHDQIRPMSVSDDFAEFLVRRPGSYIVLGNGEKSFPLHHPKYDFNDELIAPASAYWGELVRSFLRN